MTVANIIESRLLNYIADSGLHSGLLLPKESELAKLLECSEEELSSILTDMANRGLLEFNLTGWTPLNPEEHDVRDIFSFSKEALIQGHPLITKVIEKAIRLPDESDEDEVWSNMEKRAQASLGLNPDQPFIVIVRLRKLADSPKDSPKYALSRVYLNPFCFPADFIDSHDFSQESLIHVYRKCGYEVTRRSTILQSRVSNLYERIDLKLNGYEISPIHPVLHAEQELFAKNEEKAEFQLVFLQTTYVNWSFAIKNHPM